MVGFIGTLLFITINYGSSQSVIAFDSLHSLLGYEYFSSTVTDLVLIYESDTSTAATLNDDCLSNDPVSQSQIYFTTSGLPSITSSWRQAP
jgi:hypothetical protein